MIWGVIDSLPIKVFPQALLLQKIFVLYAYNPKGL